jgi:hypothetical protein
MNMPSFSSLCSRAWLANAAALSCVGLLACTPEAISKTQLLLQVETDLSAADGLGFIEVQVLDVSGDNVHDSHWFSVAAACLDDDHAKVILGSMGVPKEQRNLARLQVVGYARNDDGSATRAITTRVDASFKADTILALPILLERGCYRRADDACEADDAEQACEPLPEECGVVVQASQLKTSSAGDKQSGDCLTELQDPPAESTHAPATPGDAGLLPMDAGPPEDLEDGATQLEDGATQLEDVMPEPAETSVDSASPPVCLSEDGVCAQGCTPAVDTDCRKAKGEACAQASECKPSLYCAQGYCCDKPCTGACEQCNATESLGTCSAIDFQKRDDAANCRACGRVCSGTHVEPMCSAGECVGACEPGYGDCNNNKQADGCEADLRTEDNCAVCGRQCSRVNASTAACTDKKCVPTCVDGFMDCNADSANDGCEQNIQTDPLHCGGCGDAYRCLYPFCHARSCARARGQNMATGTEVVPQSTITGVLVNLPRPTTFVGFGGLFRNTSQPAAGVRFALYEASADESTPTRLRAQSALTRVIDYVPTVSPGPPLYTFAPVAPIDVLPGDYWVLVIADKPIEAMTEAGLLDLRWQGDSTGFVDFAASNPGGVLDLNGRQVLDLDVFVIEGS